MDKKNILITVLVIALVASGYLVWQGRSAKIEKPGDGALLEKAVAPRESLSITDVLASNKPLICQGENESNQTFVIAVDGGRARIETKTYVDTNTVSNQLILAGYQYVWPVTENKGIKLDINRATKEASDAVKLTGNFGLDKKLSLDCNDWKVDEKIFVVPADITFDDVTDQTISNLLNNKIPLPAANK
jgi:hypothetical protein